MALRDQTSVAVEHGLIRFSRPRTASRIARLAVTVFVVEDHGPRGATTAVLTRLKLTILSLAAG